ncbi:MAG: hypothetical protein AAGJ40_11395 [Planctomycetota bacterium]
MPITPLTIDDRLSVIGGALAMATLIFGIATLLHQAISKNDERKRIQGGPIRWWVTGLYSIGAAAGALLADNRQYYMHEIVGGLGGFGILIGLLVGHIHGGIRLLLTRDHEFAPEDDGESLAVGSRVRAERKNPYAPPQR